MPLEAYAGAYRDEAYGTCRVVLEHGQLAWRWCNWKCSLEHYEDDVFLTKGEGLANGIAEFRRGADGKVLSLKMIGRVFQRVFPAK